MVANDIDQAWITTGKVVDLPNCIPFEDFSGGAGDLEAVLDIQVGFGFVNGSMW